VYKCVYKFYVLVMYLSTVQVLNFRSFRTQTAYHSYVTCPQTSCPVLSTSPRYSSLSTLTRYRLQGTFSIKTKLYFYLLLFFIFFYFYRQDLPEGQLCRYFVYSRADFGGFSPRRDSDTLHRLRSNLAGRSGPPIGSGVGVYGPQN